MARGGLGLSAEKRVLLRPTSGSTPSAMVGALRAATVDQPELEGLARDLPIEDIALHPGNLRANIDVTALAHSMRQLGQLQAITVIPVDAFLEAFPQHAEAVAGKQWVLAAGERRLRAAGEAGLATLMAWIKADLADPQNATKTFIAENFERTALTPLEEAAGFNDLRDLGMTQAEIAAQLGFSQSHISKRLSLLKLPQVAQDALMTEALSVQDALVLLDLADHDDIAVALELMTAHANWGAGSAVRHIQQEKLAAENKLKAARKAKREKVDLVDFADLPAAQRAPLYSPDAVEKARAEGALVAVATGHGLSYYSTSGNAAGGAQKFDEAARAKAIKLRSEACARLVASLPLRARVTDDLVYGALRHQRYGDGLKLAHKWLAGKVGAEAKDPYEWVRETQASGDSKASLWIAWAMVLANRELKARDTHRGWDTEDVAWVQRLVDEVGYTPTPWETARLKNR